MGGRMMTKQETDRMFALMKEKGISSNQMCKIIGCDYPQFLLVVQGKRQFYGKWQKKIAQTLGKERGDLFDGK